MRELLWPWEEPDSVRAFRYSKILERQGVDDEEVMGMEDDEELVETARGIMFRLFGKHPKRRLIVGCQTASGLERLADLLVSTYLFTFERFARRKDTVDFEDVFDGRVSDDEERGEQLRSLRQASMIVYTNPDEADKRIEYLNYRITKFLSGFMKQKNRRLVFLMLEKNEKRFKADIVKERLMQVFPQSYVMYLLENTPLYWEPLK